MDFFQPGNLKRQVRTIESVVMEIRTFRSSKTDIENGSFAYVTRETSPDRTFMALLGEKRHQGRKKRQHIAHISSTNPSAFFIRENRGTAAAAAAESAYCATQGNFHARHTSRDEEDVALAPVVIAPKRARIEELSGQPSSRFPFPLARNNNRKHGAHHEPGVR